jgi:hypothetical protein
VTALGRNGTDFTGLALLLGLGFIALKFWNFKLPELSIPTPVFDFSGLFNGGYTPTPSYKIMEKYAKPPTPRTMPNWMEDLIHEPERQIDLHKELARTKGETSQWIIERGLTPSIPKNGSKVKDLHKEMESLKEETGLWIAKRPELYLNRYTRR